LGKNLIYSPKKRKVSELDNLIILPEKKRKLDFQRDEPESIRSFSNSEKETSSSDSEDNPKLIREKRLQ